MMWLSRFWYVVLALLVALAVYIAFPAASRYNRQNRVVMTEGLAADSQVVRWALQIDARRRLDALLAATVDKRIQDGLIAANGHDKAPAKAKADAGASLDAFNQKLPAEYKYDALFAVDRDGRVVARRGFDEAKGFDDFELGGYPAVNDALHGYLRDDVWVLGGRMYRVVARPVEFDVTQPPAGAVVGLRQLDTRFAQELSKLTRTNIAFYAWGARVASAAASEGIDDKTFDALLGEMPKVQADEGYRQGGRSGVHGATGNLAAMFGRFEGEAWDQRAGFMVVRSLVSISGPMGFLNGADDKDKSQVPRVGLCLFALLLATLGIGFTALEHSLPISRLRREAARLKAGHGERINPASMMGEYRVLASDINEAIDRMAKPAPAMAAALPIVPTRHPTFPTITSTASQEILALTLPRGPLDSMVDQVETTARAVVPREVMMRAATGNLDATVAKDNVPQALQAVFDAQSKEEAEWRTVYETFVRTRQTCGESIENLTFERFKKTLQEKRDALVERYKCKGVEFSVSVKQERASLKATPVSD